jgi:glycogen debranching enzyme
MRQRARILIFLIAVLTSFEAAIAQRPAGSLQVTRDAHPWEFLDAVGQKAAIFGNESGTVEGWVYPLKFFKDLHLVFHADQRVIPAEALARTVITRPESTTIVYASDDFSVRETFFTPVNEPAAMIFVDATTDTALQIEVQLTPDVQLAWPAGIGGAYFNYDEKLGLFRASADGRKLFGIFGAPNSTILSLPYDTNYSSSHTVSIAFNAAPKTQQHFVMAWTLSMETQQAALSSYHDILDHAQDLMSASAKYYDDYLAKTVNISIPDAALQSAYDWSRIGILQGMVNSPGDGYGMIAGYRTSFNYRAGFNWFFGRDSMWTSLALLKEGDFANVKAALNFLAKFQRDDGKIPHEIAHLATETDWIKSYHYAYASADGTPLFLIIAREYLRTTGDQAWLKENWDHLARAYNFLLSTRGDGFWPKNRGVGHGWVEGGPLLPMETEFYQAGLSVEALDAMNELAIATGRTDTAEKARKEADALRARLDVDFWSSKNNTLSIGIDASGKTIERPTVLVAAPLWWPLVSDDKAQKTLNFLATPEIATDWCSRIISNKDPLYDPSGYHFGSAWPLFTGWASVANYQFHRPIEACAQLRDNALLTHTGLPGRTTEVLSGNYFEPLSTSSPHQIWSSAMVVSPILRGMFGLDARAGGTVSLAPHFPATWNSASIDNIKAAGANLAISYTRTGDLLIFKVENRGDASAKVTLSPAIAATATVVQSTLDGRAIKADVRSTSQDLHPTSVFSAAANSTHTVTLRVKNDFGLEYISQFPPRGFKSEGLRISGEQWSGSTVAFTMSGITGHTYTVKIGGDAQVASVDNAKVMEDHGERWLQVAFTGDGQGYETKAVTVHLRKR